MLKFASVVIVGVGLWATAVQAADMTGADIKTLISGNTAYLSLRQPTAGTGEGIIFYNADGNATFKTPKGAIWHGSWVIKDNTVCIDWKELPEQSPARVTKRSGRRCRPINTADRKAARQDHQSRPRQSGKALDARRARAS